MTNQNTSHRVPEGGPSGIRSEAEVLTALVATLTTKMQHPQGLDSNFLLAPRSEA